MSDQRPEDKYQQGFNEGYIITKHLPDLSDSLAAIESENPRLEGFRDGREEFVLEKIKEKQQLPKPAQNKDLQPDKTKDQDIEPEC